MKKSCSILFIVSFVLALGDPPLYEKYEPYTPSDNIEKIYSQLQNKWKDELASTNIYYSIAIAKWPSPDYTEDLIIGDYIEVIDTVQTDISMNIAEYYERNYAYGKTRVRQDRIVTNEDFKKYLEEQLERKAYEE